MPTILNEQGFRISFFSADGAEPPHVHIRKDRGKAKWWLDPLREQSSKGLNASERSKLERILRDNQAFLLSEWRRYFGRA